MAPALILFLIIFLEGYVVLSSELLAIRLLIPFTGSGTDTISIIIAAVLMPLAFGYYAGGQFKMRKNGQHKATIRKKLIYNLVVSAVFLSFGLSYVFLNWLFEMLFFHTGIRDRVVLTTLYATVFLVYPVFLLGQTVPLISNYFLKANLSVTAGKILFFSTLGSFMGAVFCTLVLMTYLGVHYAVCITIGCIAILVMMLSKKLVSQGVFAALACLAITIALNNGMAMEQQNIVANNKYHTVQIEEFGNMRTMMINKNMSASMNHQTGKSDFNYINYMERVFIDPLKWRSNDPYDILVIGAGGFTLGVTDKKNNYVFVDIDKDLKDIAEEKLLEQKLTPNKKFEAVPARAFLYQSDQKFDLVLLDIFRGPSKTPEHLVTAEFLQQVKEAIKPGGVMAANYIVSANFSNDFAIKLDNTIRHVFKNVNRMTLGDYNAWEPELMHSNVIYSYFDKPDAPTGIYTDDKNSAVFDKPSSLH